MSWKARARRIVVGALVAGLIAISAIESSHHHDGPGDGPVSCATCRLVHVPVLAATPVLCAPVTVVVEWIATPNESVERDVSVDAASPRGPPPILA